MKRPKQTDIFSVKDEQWFGICLTISDKAHSIASISAG